MRIAALDVGSNSFHLMVAEVETGGHIRVLDRAKEMVRLGDSTLHEGVIPPEVFRRGLDALKALRAVWQALRGVMTARKLLRREGVDAVMAGGGYIAGPVGAAAVTLSVRSDDAKPAPRPSARRPLSVARPVPFRRSVRRCAQSRRPRRPRVPRASRRSAASAT